MSMTDLHSYRLNSLEEPTDEQLQGIMEQVAIAARRSTERYHAELRRRMQELFDKVAAYRAECEKDNAEK